MAIISAIVVLLLGLWKLEHSFNFRFAAASMENAKMEKKAKQLALKKRRIYESNPNLDFDLPNIFGGHFSQSSGVANTFGQRNIVSPDRR